MFNARVQSGYISLPFGDQALAEKGPLRETHSLQEAEYDRVMCSLPTEEQREQLVEVVNTLTRYRERAVALEDEVRKRFGGLLTCLHDESRARMTCKVAQRLAAGDVSARAAALRQLPDREDAAADAGRAGGAGARS